MGRDAPATAEQSAWLSLTLPWPSAMEGFYARSMRPGFFRLAYYVLTLKLGTEEEVSQVLDYLARPTRFERATPAFGGQCQAYFRCLL